MRLLAQLFPFLRPHRPEHGPVPQLLAEWPERRGARIGAGVYLRRLGGPRVLTPRGSLPRLRGIEAVRGYCLSRMPIHTVELLLDGVLIHTVPVTPEPAPGTGLAKYVFNAWHDFGAVTPGLHRLTVRPEGWASRLRTRNRRIVVEASPLPGDAPDSDAYIPRGPEDRRSPDAIVAALPSIVRPTRPSILPAPVRSILVLRADQLGDLIVSIAPLLRLRALFPEARLIGLVTQANLDLARTLGLFDTIEVAAYAEAPEGRRVMPLPEQERLRDAFAAYDFDIAVDFGEGAQSRLLLLLSGARFLYGFRHGEPPWLTASFEFNARDAANGMEVMPPARKLLAMVEALGSLRAAPPLTMPVSKPNESRLAEYGIGEGQPFLVLHTGARLVPSRWPGFAELALLLLRRTQHTLLIFTHGEPWEAPAGCTPPEAARLRVIDRMLPFADFDALLGGCAVFVGNDSGPKHLAALRGAKVVSLHMARLNWNEWGQEGEGLIVSRRVPCAGCNIGDQPDECGRAYACIREITPEEVCSAVLSLL